MGKRWAKAGRFSVEKQRKRVQTLIEVAVAQEKAKMAANSANTKAQQAKGVLPVTVKPGDAVYINGVQVGQVTEVSGSSFLCQFLSPPV